MLQVKSEAEFNERIAEKRPTVAVFKADWCPDCKFIEPFMPEVVENYREQFAFIQADRDELPEVFEKHQVLGIPSFIVFSEGRELTRFVSKLRKTREEIERFLDRSAQVAQALASGMQE